MKSLAQVAQSVSNRTISTQSQRVAFIVDTSGSTFGEFKDGVKLLDKEIAVLENYVLKNIRNDYSLYSFDTVTKYHGPLDVNRALKLVNTPQLKSSGLTQTASAFREVRRNFATNPVDRVILFTDGQSDSGGAELTRDVGALKALKIVVEVVAVTTVDGCLENIKAKEEFRLPGLDLINSLGNEVDKLTIYSRYHHDEPFEGVQSSSINKKALTFIGVPFDGAVSVFLNLFLEELEREHKSVDFRNHMSVKKMICDVGRLLSVLFITFPDNIYVSNLCRKIASIAGLYQELNQDDVLALIKHGYECTKSKIPIIFTNFEERVKDSAVKRNEYKDAAEALNVHGTTLGQPRRVCLPHQGCYVIDESALSLPGKLANLPMSRDAFGNVYFGIDAPDQAIRMGLRSFFVSVGFKDARTGPDVIFGVLNYMGLMFLNNIKMEEMTELRKLAIAQTSMETMVSPNKYDGVGCYAQWKAGKLIRINFAKPDTHASLYTNRQINPLGLPEPLWWAFMMSMLGLYEEQYAHYSAALKAITNTPDVTESEFLEHMKSYKDKVTGVCLVKKYSKAQSAFSLDDYTEHDDTYILKDHESDTKQMCTAKTVYSMSEMKSYVFDKGCLWCKYVPVMGDFEPFKQVNAEADLKAAMTIASKLTVVGAVLDDSSLGDSSLGDSSLGEFKSQNATQNGKYRINLVGITGAGKTTVAKILERIALEMDFKVTIASADFYSKKGIKGKGVGAALCAQLKKFDKATFNPNKPQPRKLVIVDLCNERKTDNMCFGFDMSEYKTMSYAPNFSQGDNFNDYESWCLNNVLSRGACDGKCDYWLNPVDADVSVCVNVHTSKSSAIASVWGLSPPNLGLSSSSSLEQTKELVRVRAQRHADVLKGRDLEASAKAFLVDLCQ